MPERSVIISSDIERNNAMIKIVVSGSCGKMGRRIGSLVLDDGAFRIVRALERPDSECVGKDYGELLGKGSIGVRVTGSPAGVAKGADAIIDFSTPQGALALVAEAVNAKTAMVIGVTGFSEEEKGLIQKASRSIPIILSPNMSIGVNLVFSLIEESSKALGREYRVSIREAHHIHKKDAPSGTAKELARIVTETVRDAGVRIESIREGEIVGDHTVTFESPFDKIEITHSAKTRDIFAKGALSAAKFIVTKPRGLFTMGDILRAHSMRGSRPGTP